mgnify:CR=1 FL=1
MSRRSKWLLVAVLAIIGTTIGLVVLTRDAGDPTPVPEVERPEAAVRPEGHRFPASIRTGEAAVAAHPIPLPSTPAAPPVPPEVLAARRATLRGHIGPTDVAALRIAARADPTNHQRWLDLASALNQQGKYEMAAKSLRRALKVGGEFEGRRSIERLLRDYEVNGPVRARVDAAAARSGQTAEPAPQAKPDPKKKPYR